MDFWCQWNQINADPDEGKLNNADQPPLYPFPRYQLDYHSHHWLFNDGDLFDHAAILQFAKLPSERATLAGMRTTIGLRIAFLDSAPPPTPSRHDEESPSRQCRPLR